MKTSEDITELAKALAKCQPAVEGAKRDKENPAFKKPYADLSSVWDAIQQPMADNGLSLIQFPIGDGADYAGVVSRLLHESGQWMEEQFVMPVVRADPQAFGSAFTYARRYAAMAIFGVCPEDDDGAGASQGGGWGRNTQHQERNQRRPDNVDANGEIHDAPRQTAMVPGAFGPGSALFNGNGSVNWTYFWATTKTQLGYSQAEVHRVAGSEQIRDWAPAAVADLLGKLRRMRDEVNQDGPPDEDPRIGDACDYPPCVASATRIVGPHAVCDDDSHILQPVGAK